MNLINLLVKDIVQFAAENNLDLNFIIKLIDYRLASIELNIESEQEVETYINNVRIVNNLFLMLGLATQLNEKERVAYNNETVIKLLDNPSRLINYKDFKVKLYETHFKEEVLLFEEYINLGG